MNRLLTQGGLAVLALLASIASSAEEEIYSKPTANQYPLNVYWGDTHLHSRNSADAYSLGNMNLTQADAYRFAQGQEVVAHNGMKVRLRRPLDFLVVSDHAENFGLAPMISGAVVAQTQAAQALRRALACTDLWKPGHRVLSDPLMQRSRDRP